MKWKWKSCQRLRLPEFDARCLAAALATPARSVAASWLLGSGIRECVQARRGARRTFHNKRDMMTGD